MVIKFGGEIDLINVLAKKFSELVSIQLLYNIVLYMHVWMILVW